MSEIDKESLSALLDNEADDLELRRFLKSCEQDPVLLETWERYSLVQSVLRESAVPVNASLSEKIAAQIEMEAPLSVIAASSGQPAWQQGLAKIAIAASVAAVFTFAMQLDLNSGTDSAAIPTLAGQSTDGIDSADTDSQRPAALLAESANNEAILVNGGIVEEYIDSLSLDEEQPVRIEHIQDSPLYRLVNELQIKP